MIDLRSDTVTKPDERMRRAMYEAEVGDDVYGEDPTVNRLEQRAAEILGKEAALFVTSGTQGNQIAGLIHCRPGQEVILESQSHIFLYEGGAMSALAGVQLKTIDGIRGAMDPTLVEAAIRGKDIHEPETGLICLENTHNKAGGAVLPVEHMKAIYEVAQAHNIPVHLDGARLFNAQAATGIPVAEFANYTDTVQFCLSKGLGAPVGSIIAGSADFIHQARKWRKRLGGGLRQVGVLAAPALIALEENPERLQKDHQLAKLLAEGIRQLTTLRVVNEVDTNILLVELTDPSHTTEHLLSHLKDNSILAGGFGAGVIRLVTNNGIDEVHIQQTLHALSKF
ncbi:low-specificity L-threonine aldolase [Chryseomicrobium sp. FSL W7-1435]|uniref:low-specificity L-threonine aldolase n=1 Tax=Chryseomicrobium sp. FSL W7-1435 TaxID=2921704 RepID=UPI00315A389A